MRPGSEVTTGVTPDGQSRQRRLWEALTGPPPALTDPHQQLKARLLSSILIFLIPLGIGLAALPSLFAQHGNLLTQPIYQITLATCAVLALLYAISRSRYYQVAAVLTVIVITVTILTTAFIRSGNPITLTFLFIPIMITGLLFKPRQITVVMVIILAVTGTLPLIAAQYVQVSSPLAAFSLILVLSTLLLLLLDHRDRLEHYRRKALEELVRQRTQEVTWANDQLEAILSNAPDSLMLLSADGRIATVNQTFSKQLGYLAHEMFYQPIQNLVMRRHQDALDTLMETARRSGSNVRMDVTAQRKDGSTFDADIALAPFREADSIAGFVCSLRDISQLKEVDRMKDAFISNVSHELRTPITSLKLYYELLGMNPQKYSEYFSSIQREMQRLERIVEDLLLLSRMEQGRVLMNRVPVDLNSVTTDIITDRGPLAENRGLSLILRLHEPLPDVSGDRGLIGQVISILLTNAINYTPRDGKVCVMTRLDPGNNPGQVGLIVMDTGPGIHEDERDLLFTRFYRGQASEGMNVPGTGLGLAIAREIVERHGGTIEIDNGSNAARDGYSGACFNVWLPAASGN